MQEATYATPAPADREHGAVVILKKKFGFIKSCNHPLDTFFHFSELQDGLPAGEIQVGSEVQFCMGKDPKSGRAVAIGVEKSQSTTAHERVHEERHIGQVIELPRASSMARNTPPSHTHRASAADLMEHKGIIRYLLPGNKVSHLLFSASECSPGHEPTARGAFALFNMCTDLKAARLVNADGKVGKPADLRGADSSGSSSVQRGGGLASSSGVDGGLVISGGQMEGPTDPGRIGAAGSGSAQRGDGLASSSGVDRGLAISGGQMEGPTDPGRIGAAGSGSAQRGDGLASSSGVHGGGGTSGEQMDEPTNPGQIGATCSGSVERGGGLANSSGAVGGGGISDQEARAFAATSHVGGAGGNCAQKGRLNDTSSAPEHVIGSGPMLAGGGGGSSGGGGGGGTGGGNKVSARAIHHGCNRAVQVTALAPSEISELSQAHMKQQMILEMLGSAFPGKR